MVSIRMMNMFAMHSYLRMVKGGNTMNLQQPYSDEAFQLQTKILTEDNPHDLERIVNDYLEILAYKKTCRVVDITYQMRKNTSF